MKILCTQATRTSLSGLSLTANEWETFTFSTLDQSTGLTSLSEEAGEGDSAGSRNWEKYKSSISVSSSPVMSATSEGRRS